MKGRSVQEDATVEANEQLRRKKKVEEKEGREKALVRCAGAISVNHRVITAPIIRYRDSSAERGGREGRGYHDRTPGIC